MRLTRRCIEAAPSRHVIRTVSHAAGGVLVATVLAAAAILPSSGCGKVAPPRDPLAQLVAELDLAVAACKAGTGGSAVVIRNALASEMPAARAAAAHAAGAARDWESMPVLIALLEDDDRVVRGRAASAIAELLGRDYEFDPDAPFPERTAIRERIVASYQQMVGNVSRSHE